MFLAAFIQHLSFFHPLEAVSIPCGWPGGTCPPNTCSWVDLTCQAQQAGGAAIQSAIASLIANASNLAHILISNAEIWFFGGVDPANNNPCTVNGTGGISPANCVYPVLTWLDQGVTGGNNSFGTTLANFYGYIQPAGMMVVAAAAAARLVKVMFEHRAPGHAVILDVLPRAGIGMLVIAGAAPVLLFIVNASSVIGHGWWQTISPNISWGGVTSMAVGQGIFAAIAIIIATFLTGGTFLIIFFIPILVIILLVLYLLVLWLGRMIILLFTFTTAPVCIACAVYDPGNRFTKWWMGQFMTALVMPSVIAIGMGVTVVAASQVISSSVGGVVIGTLLGYIILIGGLWYTGKMVHGLMGETFSHGGVMKAVEMALGAVAFAPNAINGMKSMFTGDSLMAKRAQGAAAKEGASAPTPASSTPSSAPSSTAPSSGKSASAYAREAFSSTGAGQSYVADVNAGDMTGFTNPDVAADYAMEDMRISSPQIYGNLTKELGAHQLGGNDASSAAVQATMMSYLNIARLDRMAQGKAA